MQNESAWERFRAEGGNRLAGAGIGAVRVALLFGSAGLALTLIVAPITENNARGQATGVGVPIVLDHFSTGSVRLR